MCSGDNGIAARTVPTGKSLAKTQSLVSKSQTTDAAPSEILDELNKTVKRLTAN